MQYGLYCQLIMEYQVLGCVFGMDIMSRIVHTLFPLRSNVKKDINKKQTYDVLYTCCQYQYPLLVFYIRQTSVENDYPIRRGRSLFYCDILYT